MPRPHICPECHELAVHRRPWKDRTDYAAHGLKTPEWAHGDGTPLCPVIGPRGYQPAQPAKR
ncbi:hypothetical protein CC117_00725 [Parafrankia colletiae]|uniref:Uncharacterized protein n=1 Tax=Parafrankia colletiae TaxID=573497 RepID=A0A1S1RHI8_9ACTN|nr:hypothetical protein [Parafrankia colletiae]MCK9904281.1 hypothetical protein [Frankia sp. Cpl3]OHV46213.1 hypothetical protein CC117_00725 [Parafrankia colletiae]